mmetsp:Transcript_77802/g.130611  ORF Transcript_77802/g.130611 Transcript_77802/m.130611 type:complete len:208 (-) Transcript_77802:779-1402(-)
MDCLHFMQPFGTDLMNPKPRNTLPPIVFLLSDHHVPARNLGSGRHTTPGLRKSKIVQNAGISFAFFESCLRDPVAHGDAIRCRPLRRHDGGMVPNLCRIAGSRVKERRLVVPVQDPASCPPPHTPPVSQSRCRPLANGHFEASRLSSPPCKGGPIWDCAVLSPIHLRPQPSAGGVTGAPLAFRRIFCVRREPPRCTNTFFPADIMRC